MAGNFKKKLADYWDLARANGIELIGEMPANANTKVLWRCPVGHEWQTTYCNIKSGTNCPTCSNDSKRSHFEIDYRYLAEEHGYEFLGPVPQASDFKTRWRCERRHEWKASFRGLQGCPYCASNGMKLPEDYHVLALSIGFEWLGPEVGNGTKKTKWKCNNGHIIETGFANLREHGCYMCIKNRPKTEGDYIAVAFRNGITYLGPFPSNTSIKTNWRCSQGHIVQKTYHAVRDGHICSICSGNQPLTSVFIIDLARGRDLEWLGPMVKSGREDTVWRCHRGHIWKAPVGRIKAGAGCRKCFYESNSGPRNPNWRGGGEQYPDVYDQTSKRKIRRRDGYECQVCHKPKEKNHRALDVHHIVPARYAPIELRNDPKNLITVCIPDHSLMECQLSYSILYLRNKLSIRYGYTYNDNPSDYIS